MMTADERAIRELIAIWLAASKAGDNARVLGLMTDDVVFLVPGHPPMRGKAAFAAAQDGLRGVSMEATSDIEEVCVSGDWAYAWTNLRVEMTPPMGKAAIVRSGQTLSIFKRVGGTWLLHRDANLLVPSTGKRNA